MNVFISALCKVYWKSLVMAESFSYLNKEMNDFLDRFITEKTGVFPQWLRELIGTLCLY